MGALQTFEASLRHAVRERQAATVGGGHFTHQELKEVLSEIEALRNAKAQLEAMAGELKPVLCIDPRVIDPATGKVRNGTGALTYSDIPNTGWSMPLYAAPVAQQPQYTHADVTSAHTEGYKLGLMQVDRPTKQPQAEAVPKELLEYEATALKSEEDGHICDMALWHDATLLNADGSVYAFTQEQLLSFTKANRTPQQAEAVLPGHHVVVATRRLPSGRFSHTIEADTPLPIGAILHTQPQQAEAVPPTHVLEDIKAKVAAFFKGDDKDLKRAGRALIEVEMICNRALTAAKKEAGHE